MEKEKKKENLETKETENELTEDSVTYQIATSIEWIEGLMQRIQQSLISNTPLIMCKKDLDALDFQILVATCVEPKLVLAKIEEIKEKIPEE